MISAQIKKGNTYLIDTLEDYLLQMITLPTHRTIKPIKYNYYNFIQTITQALMQFTKSKNTGSFNLFLIDYYVRKYDKESQLYRHFFGLTQSWKRFVDNHQDSKLFLSLLSQQRNNKQSIKKFLKIRKIILKTIQAKILQQISVTHSDALTICHMIFDGDNRGKIIKKINTLFINLKRKLVNTAKINGAVATQFFVSAAQQLDNQSFPLKLLTRNTKTSQKIRQTQTQNNKNKQNYDLSFSQQYACYAKNKNMGMHLVPELQQDENQNIFDDSCGEQYRIKYTNQNKQEVILNEFKNNLEEEWVRERGILNLDDAKKSLNKLSRKDRDIDAKLHGSGLIQWNNYQQYPEGWQQFIQNNQMQKQKLLNGNNGNRY